MRLKKLDNFLGRISFYIFLLAILLAIYLPVNNNLKINLMKKTSEHDYSNQMMVWGWLLFPG